MHPPKLKSNPMKSNPMQINLSPLFANKIELSENQDGGNKLRNKINWPSHFFHQLVKLLQELDHLLQF